MGMMNGDGTNPNKEVAREGETERGGIMQLSRRAKRRCTDVAGKESEAKKCAPPSLCSAFLQDKASGADADAAPVENTVSNVA